MRSRSRRYYISHYPYPRRDRALIAMIWLEQLFRFDNDPWLHCTLAGPIYLFVRMIHIGLKDAWALPGERCGVDAETPNPVGHQFSRRTTEVYKGWDTLSMSCIKSRQSAIVGKTLSPRRGPHLNNVRYIQTNRNNVHWPGHDREAVLVTFQ